MLQQGEHTGFVFVIPAFNCQDAIQQTLLSVIAQSYPFWRILLFIDVATDHTFERANELISMLDLHNRVKIAVNTKKCGEVINTLTACKEIADDEVVCRLDGGDWLVDNDILAYLNAIYVQENPALVWTSHRWSFSKKNISGPLPNDGNCDVYKALRGENWCVSHMKTYRRDAMNGINDANFRNENGDYIMIACDRAIFLPILHKAKIDNKKRIHVGLTAYHYELPINDPNLFTNERSINQRKSADFIHDRGFIV